MDFNWMVDQFNSTSFRYFKEREMIFLQVTRSAVEMADIFRAEGKIYVVLTVLGIIFGGLLAYLIYLDKKINRLEKRNKE
jgi:CcmD family protein